jgi:hypothetical protein
VTEVNEEAEMDREEQPAKVLVVISGGVGDYVAQGNVEVVLVDQDNIDAGDPRVVLDESWRPLTLGVFDQAESKYVTLTRARPRELVPPWRISTRDLEESRGAQCMPDI